MTRVDELQKKYPSIPRDVIVKLEVVVHNVRDGEDVDKASDWEAAPALYQSYDSVNLQDVVKERPERVKQSRRLRLVNMCLKSGLGASIRLDSTSPYTIRQVTGENFGLYEGGEKVEDIYFPRAQSRTGPEPVTSKGTPISSLIEFRRHCFVITPVRHCEYFSLGQQCKFCNLNPSYEDARSVGLDHLTAIDLEDTAEAYKIRTSEVGPLVEGYFVMGGFMKAEHEARVFVDFVGRIASAASPKPNLTVRTQAMDKKDMQRLRDAGLDALVIQLEVMDPRLFPEICPGKSKHMSYERWLQAFHDATNVFGEGNVGCKLVSGVTLLSPNGHRTWREARDHHIEANAWLISAGVLPAFLPLWWAPGSVFAEDKSNLKRFPPTEYHLEVALAHHKSMMERGLYTKMNKFMYCGLQHHSAYSGDLGILALAGDVGNWMADVVPEEANWIAKFIRSVKPPEQTISGDGCAPE